MSEILDPVRLASAVESTTADDWREVFDEYVAKGILEKLPDGRYSYAQPTTEPGRGAA